MIEILVLTELCKLLGANLPQLKLEASFIENGGDSLGAAALVALCKTHGCVLAREMILTSCTLWEILYSVRESGAINASSWLKRRPKNFMQVFSHV
jgi:acyl carrier protein